MPRTKTELSFNDKLKILDAVISQEKSGQRVNFTLIGKDFKVDRSTVSKISKDRAKLQAVTNGANLCKKRNRTVNEQDVDDALYVWYEEKLQEQSLETMRLQFKSIEDNLTDFFD